ncbi:hypothetical protein M0R45_031528 [Rubus argutus]|uniref:RNase H type-1 domain-containing protein n=1 Tax=Rubus argutus TaxID=59490 RepID=A0AAW1WE97_RUBAR
MLMGRAVSLESGRRGLGAVLRRWDGFILATTCKGLIGNFSPRATELFAASLGLQLAKNGSFSHIVLEMDAKEVIVFLNSDEDCWSVDGALVDSIKSLFNCFSVINCLYAPRDCNQAAHELAKYALLFPDFHVWVCSSPVWLTHVLVEV